MVPQRRWAGLAHIGVSQPCRAIAAGNGGSEPLRISENRWARIEVAHRECGGTGHIRRL